MRHLKTQNTLYICTVSSESSQAALWVANDPKSLQMDSVDGQTDLSLSWAHINLVGNAVARFKCKELKRNADLVFAIAKWSKTSSLERESLINFVCFFIKIPWRYKTEPVHTGSILIDLCFKPMHVYLLDKMKYFEPGYISW